MPLGKKVLLAGDTSKIRLFQRLLEQQGVLVTQTPNIERVLTMAKADPPDGIVFILPVYWESVADFVAKIREEKLLGRIPIIYFGDFIEASDQRILKQQGVHTMTLGPVPEAEAVRFIMKIIG